MLFSACVVYRPKQGIHKVLYIFAWFLAVSNLLLATRRTAIVAAILILLYYLINNKLKIQNVSSLLKIIGVLIVVVVAILILYKNNSTVHSVVDRAYNLLISGINTYVGKGSLDSGAGFRRTVLETVPYELVNNTSTKEIILGHGFMEGWFDVPYIQAFWDMGLLGGVFFIIVQLIIPIKYLLFRINNPAIQFAQCCVISRLVDNIASGVCYGTCFNLVMLIVFIIQDSEVKPEETTEIDNSPLNLSEDDNIV